MIFARRRWRRASGRRRCLSICRRYINRHAPRHATKPPGRPTGGRTRPSMASRAAQSDIRSPELAFRRKHPSRLIFWLTRWARIKISGRMVTDASPARRREVNRFVAVMGRCSLCAQRWSSARRFHAPGRNADPTPWWTGPSLNRGTAKAGNESTAVPESQRVIYGDCDQKKGSGYHAEKGHGE